MQLNRDEARPTMTVIAMPELMLIIAAAALAVVQVFAAIVSRQTYRSAPAEQVRAFTTEAYPGYIAALGGMLTVAAWMIPSALEKLVLGAAGLSLVACAVLLWRSFYPTIATLTGEEPRPTRPAGPLTPSTIAMWRAQFVLAAAIAVLIANRLSTST
jgi:hypothetical protein